MVSAGYLAVGLRGAVKVGGCLADEGGVQRPDRDPGRRGTEVDHGGAAAPQRTTGVPHRTS